MKKILKFYVYSHLHIAICAVFLYAGGARLFGHPINPVVAAHVCMATLFVYSLHRFLGASIMKSNKENRYSFVVYRPAFLRIILVVSGIAGMITFIFVPISVQLALFLSGAISLGYILPLVFKKRLRDLGQSKIILISLVWAVLPVLSALYDGISRIELGLFLEHFFFIFALTLPFDIRDQAVDERAQISNIVNRFGIARVRILMLTCLSFCFIIIILLTAAGCYNWILFTALSIFYIIQLYSTFDLQKTRSKMYYLFYLDGLILIKGLIYILISG